MYFDSHAHYDDDRFSKDRDSLLVEMKNAKNKEERVDLIMNCGASMASSKLSINLAKKYDFIYCSVGVHPHNAKDLKDEDIQTMREWSAYKKVRAIGEIGLDFHYDNSPRETQVYWFKKQLKLADELNLPVVIHSREADQRCFDIIKQNFKNRAAGVVHCYAGSPEMAEEYVKLGFFIGVGGVVTYPNARKLADTVKAVDIKHIMIETDCPYLSPEPRKRDRNNSQFLRYVVEKISEIKQISMEDVARITSENAKRLFHI